MRSDRQLWIDELKKCGALWRHDGKAKRPHACYTGKNHSDRYFNSQEISPFLLEQICRTLLVEFGILRKIVRPRSFQIWPDLVVCPAFGAIPFAFECARQLDCEFAYGKVTPKGVVFNRPSIVRGKHVLVVEDTITTGNTVSKVIDAVIDGRSIVCDWILTICNWSGKEGLDGEDGRKRRIGALIHPPAKKWPASKCPLCKKGSKALRPRHGNNWEKLRSTH